MSFHRKGTLRKIFAGAAMMTAFTGVVMPQPAEAMNVAVHVSTMTAVNAANSAAAAARARHRREAQNAVIVNPSQENIQELEARGLVDATTIPYIQKTVADMHIAPGTKPDDITSAQRDAFMQGLDDAKLVAEISATTEAQAEAKGLPKNLGQYFEAAKSQLGYKGDVSLPQAKAVYDSMSEAHWQKDTKPLLMNVAMGAGGVLLVGGVAVGIASANRKKRGYGYY